MSSPARRPPIGRVLAIVVPLVTASALARTASADDKQACLAASEKGQQLRSGGKLVEAREQFNVCGRSECPKLIQQDCTNWMSEVLASLPSVVPGAKDAKGRDIVEARLTIDGTVATDTLDGKPIVLDPGVHTFVFEARGAAAAAGAAAVKEQVVVKPGEKNRIVSVTFATGDDGAAVPADGAARGTEQPAAASTSSPPIAAYVLGGLGIVALGAAGVMGLLANSDARDLRDTCAPNCKQTDVDAIQTRYTIGGVTAGVGGALLVTGVVLFIVHGSKSSPVGSASARSPGSPLGLLQLVPVAGGSAALVHF